MGADELDEIAAMVIAGLLRDVFASSALQGLLSNGWSLEPDVVRLTAEKAYQLADAMMKARAA